MWGHCSCFLGTVAHRCFVCLFVCLFVLSLQEPVSPILWEFCNQIPLAFKSHWVFRVPCWVSRLGNMLWALELLQHCGNFFGVIVLQSVGCLLGGSMMELMVTSSKRTFTTCQTSYVCSNKSCFSCGRFTADLCLQKRHSTTQKQVFLSLLWRSLLLSPGPGAHKALFAPSECLWWV